MIRKTISVLVGLVVFVLLYSVAFADGTITTTPKDDPNALTRILDLVFQILTVVLPIIATWLAHKAITAFETKTKIAVPDAIETKIDEWVEAGIHLAAERSHKKVLEKTKKLSGPEKLEAAADFVFDLANARGWIEWTKEKIKDKIEAQLGLHRANGSTP